MTSTENIIPNLSTVNSSVSARSLYINTDDVHYEYVEQLVWTEDQQALLIESMIVHYFIPNVSYYIEWNSEIKKDMLLVFQGGEYINAILKFVNNEFALKGHFIAELKDAKFEDMSVLYQRMFNQATVNAAHLTTYSRNLTAEEKERLIALYKKINTF